MIGTVDGVVLVLVGSETAGGGKRGVGGMAGRDIPLSGPAGGDVLGVGALEPSGEPVPGALRWPCILDILGDFERRCCNAVL